MLLAIHAALAADYNCDGFDDLAVGVPWEDGYGYVEILYGSADGVDTDGAQLLYQGTAGINDDPAADEFGYALGVGDFNQDACDDLAIGAPMDTFTTSAGGAGGANVLFGAPTGLSVVGDLSLYQDVVGIEGVSEAGDHLGAAFAAGDFDGSGAADLAIGAPGEAIGSATEAGAVNVVYGDRVHGFTTFRNAAFYQGTRGIQGSAAAGDSFGIAVAVGNFDGDGYEDLAVGAPGDDVIVEDGGVVSVIRGESSGLTGDQDLVLHQDLPGVSGTMGTRDAFGSALASCDFDADGYDDLAVGVPGDSEGEDFGGAVNVLYGASGGLSTTGEGLFSQETPGVPGDPWSADHFGATLACGDFDGDTFADLAVGAPDHRSEVGSRAGTVTVLYGSADGLDTADAQSWTATSTGVVTSAADQHFGQALTAGDYDGDEIDDLAIGAPGLVVNNRADAGGVVVLYGTDAGLASGEAQLWHQDVSGVPGAVEAYDQFGFALR